MNYLANALTTRPASSTSMQSFPTVQSSILEDSTPEEASGEDGSKEIDTTATSIADLEAKTPTKSQSSPRSKTTYHLAHPPPVSSHRAHLHIRPRVLLQLQRVSKTVRPKPILEVLPSVVFAPRLARRFPRTFKGKAGLGADDLVIVSSENYETAEPDAPDSGDLFDDARWEEREIIAAICQSSKDKTGRQGKAEICLNNGATWTASKLGNGSYECVSTDEHGLKTIARWVLRSPRQRIPATQSRPRSPSFEDRKFNFSVLNPNSRRHAVIGTLDPQSLEVSNRYSNPAAGAKSVCPSTPISPTNDGNLDGREELSSYPWPTDPASVCALDNPTPNSPRHSLQSADANFASERPIEMNEQLRTLILITGLWVAFQEGFSPNFSHSDPIQGQSALSTSGPKQQRRSLSLGINRSGGEALPSSARATFSNTQSTGACFSYATSSSVVPLDQLPKNGQNPPRRSMSTGSTFMRRVTSRKVSTATANQLGLVDDFNGSEAEPSSLDGSSVMPPSHTDGSPVRTRRTSSHQSTLDSPLEPVISNGLDPPGNPPASRKETPRKPRRLERLLGLRRRTGSGL